MLELVERGYRRGGAVILVPGFGQGRRWEALPSWVRTMRQTGFDGDILIYRWNAGSGPALAQLSPVLSLAASAVWGGLGAVLALGASLGVTNNALADAIRRCDPAGRDLADEIGDLRWKRGWRSVTVVGHSIGGRLALAAAQNGDVDRVLVAGGCVSVDDWLWRGAVAAGAEVTNLLSHEDGAIDLAQRGGHGALSGRNRVPIHGVSNLDATALVRNHHQYPRALRAAVGEGYLEL